MTYHPNLSLALPPLNILLKGNLYGHSYSPYTLTSLPQIPYKDVIPSQLQPTT